ncbi:MAG: SDR family NAD(P)-dependent oxidoreductase [Pseudomonadota bacterium]
MGHWQGQVAVITGAGSGIGRGLARFALGQGMRVFAADIDTRGLSALGDHAELKTFVVDVSDADAVQSFAEQVFIDTGQVNLLFNNAGILVDGKSWERSLEDWRWGLDVNVMGVVHGIRSFLPRMLEQQALGRIVNTSSIGGLLGGGPFMAIYQATKHAITAMTESLHQELLLEPAPISASVLCPGEVDTGIWHSDRHRTEPSKAMLSEAEAGFREALVAQVAAGHSPDDFAAMVFAGIDAGQFYLLPGVEVTVLLRQRVDDIANGRAPAPLFQA